MLVLLALWILLSVVLGFVARNRGRSGTTWFLIGALVSPLIGAILLFSAKELGYPEDTPAKPSRSRRFFRFVLNVVMAALVILVFISALNRGGMKPTKLSQVDHALPVQAVKA